MSVQNATTPGMPSNQPNTPTSANNRSIVAISILLGLLILVNIVYFGFKKPATEALFTDAVSQKEMALDELQREYEYTKAQLDSLRILVPDLDQKIQIQEQELEANRAKIEAGIQAGGNLAAARQQIESMSRQKDEFVLEIAKLKEQVSGLRENVSTVVRQKQEVEAAYTEIQQKYVEGQTSAAAISQEKAAAEAKVRKAQEKLEANAFLTVGMIKVQPVMLTNRKTKEKESTKAKSTDKVRICFTANPNNLVKDGEEKFQIRILYGGVTLGSEGNQGGIGRDKSTDTDFQYTLIATCQYDQSTTNVCATWTPEGKHFDKGAYEVEVYHRGRSVGKRGFTLK